MRIEDFGQDMVLLNEEMLKERAKISDGFITCCNKKVKRAKEIGDINFLGYSYYFLADAYYLITTEYHKFNTNLLKAIEYLQTCGDMEYLARCYILLGIDALNHGNTEIALDFYLNALKYSESLGSNSNIPGLINFNIGQIYYEKGDVKQALPYIKTAYKDISNIK